MIKYYMETVSQGRHTYIMDGAIYMQEPRDFDTKIRDLTSQEKKILKAVEEHYQNGFKKLLKID